MFMPSTKRARVGVLLLVLVACSKPAEVNAATPPVGAAPSAALAQARPEAGSPPPATDAGPAQTPPAPVPTKAAPVVSPPGEVTDAQVLIWGGGRTPEDGRKALERFQAEREGLEAILTLGEGYPRLMASDTLPGLNPGFHVVVLGACKPQDAKEPLETLQAFKAGVYARAVKVALGSGDCPQHQNRFGAPDAVRLTQKPFELTAVSFLSGAPSSSPVPWLVRLYLRDASGALVDHKAVDPRYGMWEGTDRNSCLPQVRTEGASVRVSVDCENLAGGPWSKERHEELEYRINEGKIEWVLGPR